MYKSIYGDECKFHIVGDLNARTGEMNDFIENDDVSYLPVPDDYIMEDSLIKTRANKDKVMNNAGKNLIELCKTCDLRIANGCVGNEAGIGDYTFMNYCGHSAIDYVLCSSSLLCHMCYFRLLYFNEFSDHRAIVFEVPLTYYAPYRRITTKTTKLSWNPDFIYQYKESLTGLTCTDKFQQMLCLTEAEAHNEHLVNSAVNLFIDGLRSAADPLFLKTKYTGVTKENMNR